MPRSFAQRLKFHETLFQTGVSSCSSPDGAYKIVHQYVPTGREAELLQPKVASLKFNSLQVVTQTLHIPPSSEVAESNNELEKLRKEVKKLREYARLSVQDRKVLIHKIGTLKDKVHETSSRKSASPLRQMTPPCTEASIQCNLLENKNYWLRFAKLQQKLVKFCEAADLMKSQLEAICDVLEPSAMEISKSNKNIGATLQNMSKSSYSLLANVSKTIEELKDSTAAESSEEDLPHVENRPLTSMSNECLPDPSEIDIEEPPCLIKHLQGELQCKDKEIGDKNVALRALSDQVEQKDKVIREQAQHLDEYRMEILHLRGEEDQVRQYHGGPPSTSKKLVATELSEKSEVKMQSDEEDSWSEPGFYRLPLNARTV